MCLEGAWPIDRGRPDDDLSRFVSAAVGLGVVSSSADGETVPGIASRWTEIPAAGRAPAWSFEIADGAVFPGGTSVSSGDVVRSLSETLRRADSPSRWLLAPVVGAISFAAGETDEIDGLIAETGSLRMDLSRATPDLTERLVHPALRIWTTGDGNEPVGAGPFRIVADRRLVAAAGAREKPYLERIELIAPRPAAPAVLARLGEIDAAVIYGRSVSRFLDAEHAPEPPFRVERLPAWDRSYLLWLDPGMRWTRDPAFRRWVDATLDRNEMLRYLFDGRGRAPCDLLFECGGSAAGIGAVTPWRVPRGVRPRIVLAFDADDRYGGEIAARIKADLESAGVGVELDPRSGDALAHDLRAGKVQSALLYVRPWTTDPVLTLLETLHRAPNGLETRIGELERAARLPPGGGPRRTEALEIQNRVLSEARVLPVVEVEAWIASAPSLVLSPRASQSLNLVRAGWSP